MFTGLDSTAGAPPGQPRPAALPGTGCLAGWFGGGLVLLLLHLPGPLVRGAPSAQEGGTVSGTVVSAWDGAALSAVVVTVRGTTLATQTDASGRYQLDRVPPGDQVLRFSKSGYASTVVSDVRVLLGQTTTVNGNLRPEFYELEEYEVTAEEFSEQTLQILEERQEASSLIDALGSEQISKLGAGDAAEALSKVTGASIADGKFAVIRGLADRYTSTTLNGTEVPSADPDRKAAQLDLFPSQFIGRMDVSKTFSPDMPGGFAGGAINIVTRDFPDDFVLTLSAGTSYNTQSSLRSDFLMSDRSSTDWLARDDGKRQLPAVAAATDPAQKTPLDPAIVTSFESDQFTPVEGDSPLNFGLSLTVGETREVFGRKLGFLGGLTYKNDWQLYTDGEVFNYNNGVNPAPVQKTDARGVIEYTWGSLVGLGYQLSDHHTLGFNFIYVQSAEDEARRLQGIDEDFGATEGSGYYVDQSILHWTERNLQYYQLKGEHQFPDLNEARLDWAGALSTTSQDEPDHRIFQYLAQPADHFNTPNGPSQPSRPSRFWRNLGEDNANVRADITVPLPSYNAQENFLKLGPALSHSQRDYSSRMFDIQIPTSNPFTTNTAPDAPNHLGTNLYYYNFVGGSFVYTGEQTIAAGYLMAEWAVFDWFQLTAGARLETTDLTVDTLNLTKGERYVSSIEELDVLPSVSAILSIRSNLLVRPAWSQTVVRPTYREIARAEFYDVARGRTYTGSTNLNLSHSDNYDLRIEWYPRSGEILSVGAFLKNIDGPIELRSARNDNSLVDYQNFEEATVYGVEFEARQNLGNWWEPLNELTLGFNYAWIHSEVPLSADEQRNRLLGYGGTDTLRPLYDQPEYIINGDLTWDHVPTGTTVTVSGGVVGRRLVLVGLQEPDEFEEPAPQLDVFLSQTLGKNWKLKFSAKNLLNPAYEEIQAWPQGDRVLTRYTKGMTFGLSVSCEF